MSTLRAKLRSGSWFETLARLAWVLLAAVHIAPLGRTAAALVREGATLHRVGVFALLVVFLSFFVLKACDVPFFRVRCRKTSLVAFLVCCGLVHGADVAQAAKDPSYQAVAWTAVMTASAAGVATPEFRRRLRAFAEWLSDVIRAALLPAPHRVYVVADAGWRSGPAPGRRAAVPRGPPR